MRRLIAAHTTTTLASGQKTGSCNACVHNVGRVGNLSGPDGPLLLAGVDKQTMPTAFLAQLRQVAEETCSSGQGAHSMELIAAGTLPPCQQTGPKGQTGLSEFSHLTVKPVEVTSPELAARLAPLWSKVESSVLERLVKFLSAGARASVLAIKREILDRDLLARPEYWRPTIDWILGIQGRFSKTEEEELSALEREELAIFAMATGHAEGSVHYNFQTSANVLDFIVMPSIEAVATEMDKRSDPATNQVSQLARAMAAKGVEAKWNVGLTWDGKKYRDDLDLRAKIYDTASGARIGLVYYGNKTAVRWGGKVLAKLDFDAGISGQEAEPAENISFFEDIVGMRVVIEVDNYNRRTHGDVPCTVSICQQGMAPIELNVVWPKDRQRGDYLFVAEHVFTSIEDAPVAMSSSQARAAAAQDAEWQQLFGTPTSVVATLQDLQSANTEDFVALATAPREEDAEDEEDGESDEEHEVHEDGAVQSVAAQDAFAGLVASAKQKSSGGAGGVGGAAADQNKKKKKNGKNKTFLSDRLEAQPPTTFAELLDRINSEPDRQHKLEIHLPDHSPGYVTLVTVKSEGALKNGATTLLSPCHYQDKNVQPLKPEKRGNARLDASWVTSHGLRQSVSAVAHVGGKYFMALRDGKLPTESTAWPHTAGFYPQDLSAAGHKHRSKWAFMNASVKPSLPQKSQNAQKGGGRTATAVGTFLTSFETATVFYNGQKLVLRV
jgi:hypothetical protein